MNIFCKKGFSLIEVILAISIFALLITGFSGIYLYGQESAVLAGNRDRAIALAEEGLEAARSIGSDSFTSLSAGTHGIDIIGNSWAFSGSSDITGIFTREITVTSVDADRVDIESEVTWQQNPLRTGSVSVHTRFTNWRDTGPAVCSNQASFLDIDTSGANIAAGNRELRGVTVENIATNCEIIIDKAELTWTSGNNLERIKIGTGAWDWTGSVTSGTEVDIANETLTASSGLIDTIYRFSGSMNGNTFTITFTMSDATTKSTSSFSP